MPYSVKPYKDLLENVSIFEKHSKELALLNGENFNIYSVLGLESAENKTHSNFLAELLNPNGSHNLGNVLLNHFISLIDLNSNFKFNSENATVQKEVSFKNSVTQESGRIDICIKDNCGYTILIENKIYAKDQPQQLKKYSNYNVNKSSLYYLTLYGKEPSQESSVDLEMNIHYKCISYTNTIKDWLELCIKEAYNQPILRESIRQYIILINKLTGQLSNKKMETEIKSLIQKNLQSANQISKLFEEAKFEIVERIRKELAEKMQNEFSDFEVMVLDNVSATNSKIWYRLKEYNNLDTYLGMEPFSGLGHTTSKLFIGILITKNEDRTKFESHSNLQRNGWWYGLEHFEKFENYDVNFNDNDFVQYLYNNNRNVENLIDHLMTKIKSYNQENLNDYIDFCKSKTL
ncbi:PD-(D/E)XK nuclease family protein [Flavobacterium davisii]|uniref:PD-(D/E)XK nuclease family protein n=1 Tax=Flavobacterium davisii TaxID=2906077 RepID=A0ABW8PPB3_9FLAO